MTTSRSTDSSPPPTFRGRTEEHEVVTAALAAERSVLLVGPGGMGKSRLVDEVVRALRRPTRRGAGIDYLQSDPFVALVQVLGRPPRSADGAAAADEVLAALAPGHLLVLDDLQWADDRTLDALPGLVRSGRLLAATRPGDPRADRALAAFEADDAGVVVGLGPLADADVAGLVEEAWPSCSPRDVDELARRSGGVPLAALALARGRGAPGTSTADEPLRAVVAGWTADMQRTLAAAHLGTGGVGPTTPGVAELVAAGWARCGADGTVASTSDALAEVAFDALPEVEQVDLHRLAAAGATGPGAAARHWLAAGDDDRAFRAAWAGADEAATPAGRADLLTLAFSCAPPDERVAVARKAGVAVLRATGSYSTILSWGASIPRPWPLDLELGRDGLLAMAAIDEGDAARAEAVARSALARATDDTLEEAYHLRNLLAASRALQFDPTGALAELDTAIELAARANRSSLRARSLQLLIRGTLGDRSVLGEADGMLAVAARRDPEAHVAFDAALQLARLSWLHLDLDRGLAILARMEEVASATDQPTWAHQARADRWIHRSMVDGTNAEVVAELDRLRAERGRRAWPYVMSAHARSLGWRGDVGAARAEVADAYPSPPDPPGSFADWTTADLAWLAGDTSGPAATVRLGVATAASGPICAVLERWRRHEAGEDLAGASWPMAMFPALAGLPYEAQGVDLLAADRPGEAVAAFDQAAEAHQAFLRCAELRCRWAAGEAARLADDRAGAAARLGALRRRCLEQGYRGLLPRIDRSLRACGVRTAPVVAGRPGPPTRGPLTPRQAEIVHLVAEGLTNEAIAARLAISERTVRTHVDAAMLRLGVSSRRAAVAALVDAADA